LTLRSWLHRVIWPIVSRKIPSKLSAGLLVALLVGALVASPPVAAAQGPAGRPVRIGYLHVQPIRPEPSPERAAFLEELQSLGYEVGRTVTIEYRSAVMRPELLPDLVEELVAARVDVIVAVGDEAAKAAKEGARSVPIVIPAAADLVGAGLVASLARPGGNLTGLTFVAPELTGKRLQLLRDAFPRATRIAVLFAEVNSGARSEWQAAEATAPTLGMTVQPLRLRTLQDLPARLAALSRDRPDAVYVIGDPMTSSARHIIVEAVAAQRLPAMYSWREFVSAGGLMAYSAPFPELFRRAAVYVDRILKGAKPAELPVEQPTKFELVINGKTAKTLGLTIPPMVLMRADHIIE
jgi:putative ABC transport system substrate-binding protein